MRKRERAKSSAIRIARLYAARLIAWLVKKTGL